MSFENRVVMITGAAGHLGRAVAACFAERGARLLVVDRQQDALAAAYGANASAVLVPADLLDAAQTGEAISAAIERAGNLDVLCHLAGGFRMGEPVHETSDATWNVMFDVNARTLLNVARAVVPRMIARKSGKVVTVGAFSAQRGIAGMGAYCAAKSSVIRLTESMSAELKEHGVNVNCVLPTIIDTVDNRAAMPDADPTRWVSPAALADVIAFLASDGAHAVHGAAIPVTGLS